jgi:hypothetical protein
MPEDNVINFAELYANGVANLKTKGEEWLPPVGGYGPTITANRKLLHATFFESKYFDPVEADSSFYFLGKNFSTTIFSTAISRSPYMDDKTLVDIARGIGKAGSFVMHGVGDNADLQAMINTGTPVIKII